MVLSSEPRTRLLIRQGSGTWPLDFLSSLLPPLIQAKYQFITLIILYSVKSLQDVQNQTKSDGGMNETFKRARHKEAQAAYRRDYTAEYNRRTEELGQRRKLPPR